MSTQAHDQVDVEPGAPRRSRRLTVIDAPADAPERTPPPTRAPRRQPARGSLLAVCALCGGAGASTLSLLLARYALAERGGSVLVCDTGGPSGGLAAYARVRSARSLLELAELVQAGLPAGQPFATTTDGVRVLAAGPRLPHLEACPERGIATVLEHARAAHPLTVVDCGTLARPVDQIALRAATHIAWVLPATRSATARVAGVLEAIDAHLLARQLLIARRDPTDAKAPMRELRRLAQRCAGPLILLPHLPGPHQAKPATTLDAAQVALQAILGALGR